MIPENILQHVFNKAILKQDIYEQTLDVFNIFRERTKAIITEFSEHAKQINNSLHFEFRNRGDYEFEVRFASDILIFVMHTNIFEFSRDHEVMKTSYIKENKDRSYCGVINIYNFLADSFNYNRDNDLGYLIGRVFINKERHYFIEGKKEIGLLYNNFHSSIISVDSIQEIIQSAMLYTVNFDLLTPPYDEVKVVSVSEMKAAFDNSKLATGKRLGFRFQADVE